jgi:hypothetical protein
LPNFTCDNSTTSLRSRFDKLAGRLWSPCFFVPSGIAAAGSTRSKRRWVGLCTGMILREQLKIPGPPKGPFLVLIGHFSSRLRPESPLMSRNPLTSWGAPAVIDRKWQFTEDSGAYRFTDKLLTTFEALTFNNINRLTGGGGGNRTRLRYNYCNKLCLLICRLYPICIQQNADRSFC